MISEVKHTDLNGLESLLQCCKYDRVIIESVLEGNFGVAYASSLDHIDLVRLDSGAFTVLSGDPNSGDLNEILNVAPMYYVTPQNEEWNGKLLSIFGSKVTPLSFTDYLPRNIQASQLAAYIGNLSPEYNLKSIDKSNAPKVVREIGNDYFFENFHSIEDYLNRGIGYCVIHEKRIVAAATSMAQCSKAIDIEIETIPEYRRRGLGTVVGAKLVLHCLENGIEPKWLAANSESACLAEKLGYSRGETYSTFEIQI